MGRGYTNEEIALIMGGNLLRLYQQILYEPYSDADNGWQPPKARP